MGLRGLGEVSIFSVLYRLISNQLLLAEGQGFVRILRGVGVELASF